MKFLYVTATVSLDGENANLRMGGTAPMAIYCCSGPTATAPMMRRRRCTSMEKMPTCGWVENGVNGDILLFADGGDRTDDLTATIHLNGNSGDIILQDADCAEEFDIGEKCDAQPGSVVVLTDEGRVGECGRAYDKRVVGIISGAGAYRPAIILDR